MNRRNTRYFQQPLSLMWGIATAWLLAEWSWAPAAASRAVMSTMAMGISTAGVALPAAMAFWLAGTGRGWMSRLVLVATVIAATAPPWLHVCGWDSAIGKLGWVTSLYTDRTAELFPRWLIAVWIHAMILAPQLACWLHVCQRLSDWRMEELAMLEASRWRIFWEVTLPRISPALVSGLAWLLIQCNREIAVTDIYQIGTVAEVIYLGYSLAPPPSGASLVASAITSGDIRLYLVFAAWILLTVWALARPVLKSFGTTGQQAFRSAFSFGSVTRVLGCLAVGLTTVPLINVVVRLGTKFARSDGQVTRSWNFQSAIHAWYGSMVDSLPEWKWSLLIGMAGASLLVVAAVVFVAISRTNRTVRGGVCLTVLFSVVMPGPAIGQLLVALMQSVDLPMWNRLWDRTILGPVLASTIFLWPAAVVMATVLQLLVPRQLLELARTSGLGPWGRLFFVTLGVNWKAITGMWLIMFVLVFGELSASHLVRPSGIDIIPRLALGKLHSGVDNHLAGLALSSLLMVLTMVLAGKTLMRCAGRTVSQ